MALLYFAYVESLCAALSSCSVSVCCHALRRCSSSVGLQLSALCVHADPAWRSSSQHRGGRPGPAHSGAPSAHASVQQTGHSHRRAQHPHLSDALAHRTAAGKLYRTPPICRSVRCIWILEWWTICLVCLLWSSWATMMISWMWSSWGRATRTSLWPLTALSWRCLSWPLTAVRFCMDTQVSEPLEGSSALDICYTLLSVDSINYLLILALPLSSPSPSRFLFLLVSLSCPLSLPCLISSVSVKKVIIGSKDVLIHFNRKTKQLNLLNSTCAHL